MVLGDRLRAIAKWLDAPAGRRWLLGLLVLVAVVGFFSWVGRPGDFRGYLLVGELVLSGGHIYWDAPPGINTWPPVFSLLCVPLTLLAKPSVYLARGVWILLNFGVLLLVLRMIARLVYKRDLGLRAEPRDSISLADAALLVPLLLTSRFVFSNFEHLQVNIILFALALGGLYLQATRRELAGGVALGCAAALKVMPILFLPYLLYRKRWRASLSMAVTTLALSLSPALAFGSHRFHNYYAAWGESLAAGWTVGKMNQSVFAMLDRFIGHGMVPLGVGGIVEVPASGDPLVRLAWWLLVVVIVVLALWLFRGPTEQGSWPSLAEWSVVFAVSAIFGPVGWKAYLIVLLLPNALLFAAARSSRLNTGQRKTAAWILAAAFVLGTLTTPGLVGGSLAGRLEMASVVTVSALVLLFGSLWLRGALRSALD